MKKAKKLLSLVLAICLIGTMFTFPVVANAETEVTSWKSSDYLNPDSPVTENNPWSLESTNNASNTYEPFDGTTMTDTGMPLFPAMPDGVTPTTAYIRNGEPNWGNQGYNMAVNGKYMIPACISTGTSGDSIKTASGKMAKVFTAPKAGLIKITAGATNGDGTEDKIATMTLAANSWDAPRQNWNIIKDGEVLATANGASRVSAGTYDVIEMKNVMLEVEEGDKIYFEFAPSAWSLRECQAFMWDPVVKYTTADDVDELPVDDTERFLSSKYLDPTVTYKDNPWTVETTNNREGTWETVTGRISAVTDPVSDAFPTMPDGVKPATGYFHSGQFDRNGQGWWQDSYNAGVSGKYMVAVAFYNGSAWVAGKPKVAKVFTAPKDGKVQISAAAPMSSEGEGTIALNKVAASWDDASTSFSVEINGTSIWSKVGDDRTVGTSYDTLNFEDKVVEVNKGDKIYFILTPTQQSPRDSQSCIWDPVVEYGNEVDDTDKFLSSKYLTPETKYFNNPWSVGYEKEDGSWVKVTGTTASVTNPSFDLFPQMEDGVIPTTGYIYSGTYNRNYDAATQGIWKENGYNMAVNGKYMVAASFWNGSAYVAARAKVAKIFTAPKDGKVLITAAPTIDGSTQGYIIPNKYAASWDDDKTVWSIEKDGTVLWSESANNRTIGSSYDTIAVEAQYAEVKAGDKLYFVLQPTQQSPRAGQACMWDPMIQYVNTVDDANSFASSKYLNPETPYYNNPWSVVYEKEDGSWVNVTGTTPSVTSPAFDLFPQMADGVTPTTGYIHSGTYNRNYNAATDGIWKETAYNMAVNGKYMVASSFWNGSAFVAARAKFAKAFTAPEDGMVLITAGATIGESTEGYIVPNKYAASWDDDRTVWSIEKDGEILWSESANNRSIGLEYDTVPVTRKYIEVEAGDTIYFVFQPTQQSPRAGQACMWDPVVTYVSRNIFGDATYANGTVTLDILKVDSSFDKNTKLIIGAFKSDETLLGSNLMLMSDVTSDGDITIKGLNEKPDVIKIFVWNFGENGDELTPISSVIERIPVE